jgi:peptidoglycan/LPS O-acetylase OafA/YrhL
MIYVVGIRVFAQLHHVDGVDFPAATVVTLITCLAVVVPAAELFHRVVEVPSKIFAHKFYDFITN